jgi:hypothetical protein
MSLAARSVPRALHLFADPGHLLDFAGFLAQGMLSPHPGFSHDQ